MASFDKKNWEIWEINWGKKEEKRSNLDWKLQGKQSFVVVCFNGGWWSRRWMWFLWFWELNFPWFLENWWFWREEKVIFWKLWLVSVDLGMRFGKLRDSEEKSTSFWRLLGNRFFRAGFHWSQSKHLGMENLYEFLTARWELEHWIAGSQSRVETIEEQLHQWQREIHNQY